MKEKQIAKFHLPGLFEFYELYKRFLDLYKNHSEYFYDFIEIASIYGAPSSCIWGGGRVAFGDEDIKLFLNLLKNTGVSARLTFSNSLLTEEHLDDHLCNKMCKLLNEPNSHNGVIVHSDLLKDYIHDKYPHLELISSTTKVILDDNELEKELNMKEFKYVVPDFRYNKRMDFLSSLSEEEKDKIELLVNECCYIGCKDRKDCYKNVSEKTLGLNTPNHICKAPFSEKGYMFSMAMKNPAFIGINDIKSTYLPLGISNFKIEGRGLGSAVVLEMLLYYLVKPEYQINVREEIYLDANLDLF
ncbi:MAG: hypothetical protein MJ190_00320 [Bacilli bacterium]|nr:hypothetical protein [Bacilli bacterium]